MEIEVGGIGCKHSDGDESARIEFRIKDGPHGDCTFAFWMPLGLLSAVEERFAVACDQCRSGVREDDETTPQRCVDGHLAAARKRIAGGS